MKFFEVKFTYWNDKGKKHNGVSSMVAPTMENVVNYGVKTLIEQLISAGFKNILKIQIDNIKEQIIENTKKDLIVN